MQEFFSGVGTIGIFALIIGVLVFIHELGHFLVAKAVDAKVEEFAIGLGPKIWSKQVGEVLYKINLFPLGGYVKILGEVDEKEDDNPRSLKNKTPFKRILVMLAGVVMNFLLASILYYSIFLTSGYKFYLPDSFADFKPYRAQIVREKITEKVEYDGLAEGKGAKLSGMPIKGEIKSIDGKKIEFTNDIPSILQSVKNKTVKIEVCSDKCKTYDVLTDAQGKIGISILTNSAYAMTYENNKIESGLVHGVNMIRIMFVSLSDVFGKAKVTGDYSQAMNTVSGPVGIYLAIDAVKQYGFVSLLGLTADLSLVLAFMNLLPIPALDGGRILLTLPELVTGKKLNSKLEAVLINVSFILLLVLMFAVFIKDIVFFDSIKELLK